MYEDVVDMRSLQEQFEDSLENAFDSFYASLALDSLMEPLEMNLLAVLHLAFLAGYVAAGGHPPGPPQTGGRYFV